MKENNVSLSKNEMWKILDAIKAYQKDYCLTNPVNKIFDNIEKKIKKIINH